MTRIWKLYFVVLLSKYSSPTSSHPLNPLNPPTSQKMVQVMSPSFKGGPTRHAVLLQLHFGPNVVCPLDAIPVNKKKTDLVKLCIEERERESEREIVPFRNERNEMIAAIPV